MSNRGSDFGTGPVLLFGIVCLLFSIVWLGWTVPLIALIFVLAGYNMLMKGLNDNFNSDGSRKRRR